jgi:hypothetical protein
LPPVKGVSALSEGGDGFTDGWMDDAFSAGLFGSRFSDSGLYFMQLGLGWGVLFLSQRKLVFLLWGSESPNWEALLAWL